MKKLKIKKAKKPIKTVGYTIFRHKKELALYQYTEYMGMVTYGDRIPVKIMEVNKCPNVYDLPTILISNKIKK